MFGAFKQVRLVFVVAVMTAACQGAVDGGRNPPPGMNPPGTGGSGPGTGGSTPPGTGGAPGTPGAIVPGRVTARRLNRVEYDNTIRDLIGLDLKPSRMFEFIEDEWGDGFNNDADVLTLAPISIEKYLTAAQYIIDQALNPTNAAARMRIMTCAPPMMPEADCAKKIIGDFAKRAFRRPVTPDEVTPYAALIDVAKMKGDNFEMGIKLALAGVLVAPEFLFRLEIDAMRGATRPLNDYELASRLSYFIWASMPDAELFSRADAGALKNPAEITKQTARMLADSKASAFTNAMVEQWMHTADLQVAAPNNKIYPMWQEPLKAAMEQELRSFLAPVLSGQVSAQDLLTARYTYANRQLAQFYGLPNAASLPTDQFTKVNLPDTRRGGVLRAGSFLVLTSHPDTHSPTRRGKFILEKLICRRPPPPPAMVPSFEPGKIPMGTLRQKLEMTHYTMGPACSGCHAFIDPMGFALENYDGVGLWREMDNGQKIDATGKMPQTGEAFNGADELSNLIAKDPRFPECMAKQVLTYALGRKMTDADQPAIEDLGKKFGGGGYKVPSLVDLISQSSLMTQRQAEKE